VKYYRAAMSAPEKSELLRLFAVYCKTYEEKHGEPLEKGKHLNHRRKGRLTSHGLPVKQYRQFKEDFAEKFGATTRIEDFFEAYCEWYWGPSENDGLDPKYRSLRHILDIRTLDRMGYSREDMKHHIETAEMMFAMKHSEDYEALRERLMKVGSDGVRQEVRTLSNRYDERKIRLTKLTSELDRLARSAGLPPVR